MCGFLAQVRDGAKDEEFLRGLRLMRSRGPDGEGVWHSLDGRVRLGHRRLAIVDLSDSGRQPMTNEDGTLWLACNGEIYNAPALRSRLEGLGHSFLSLSDSEVILHAYETWEDSCIDRLEGMFAFALWDNRRRRMLAARDRVGIKPLYYWFGDGGVTVASSAATVRVVMSAASEPDPLALAYVMTLGYVPSPWSIWRGIKKLEPGHALTWDAVAGVRIQRYWEPPREMDPRTSQESAFQWRTLLETVVQDHLMSDVPVGLFLSGGLDSSSLAACLRDIGRPIDAMTVGFPESAHDEAPLAAAVARHLGLNHRIMPLLAHDLAPLIDKVVRAFDEPQGYSALLSMYMISEQAAKDFKAILAGDGGDEAFGGYTWYRDLDWGTGGGRRWVRRALRPLVGSAVAPPTVRRRAACEFSQRSLLHRHVWRLFPRFLPEEAEALLSPMGLRFGDEEMLEPVRRHFEPSLPLKRALQRVDLMSFCADSILAKVDRASMAHALEVRVPLLDRRIVEWALRLPLQPEEKHEGKPVLREYLRSRVPTSVLSHPKRGFSLASLDGFDWEAAIRRIGRGPWVREAYWWPGWRRLLEPGVPYRESRIWVLLILTEWAEAWFGEGAGAHA
jgi:asparagine synthase (glutamine-hydrolysing)